MLNINLILNMMRNIGLILRYETRHRTRLLSDYLRLIIDYLCFEKILKLRETTENIQGFSIEFVDYRALIFMYEEIFINKVYQFVSTTKNPLIIDSGTNIGLSAIFFKTFYPECRIIAFEPDEKIFNMLKKNVQRNNRLDGVTLINKAIHGSRNEMSFYYDPSHIANLTGNLITPRHGMKTKKVDCVPLSGFVGEIVDLLKMDIEGAENSAIDELSNTGKIKLIKEIIIEYHLHISLQENDKLSAMLKSLEQNNFTYQISGFFRPPFITELFQDILIYAHNKSYD
ncbi:MAG: FkbM family methyltransferase [Desulfomonilaceae bacterium]|jgi:FkbM family methyltransferase